VVSYVNCLLLCRDAAKINEETGDDLDDNVMFDDVDGEEDDIDDVSLLLFSFYARQRSYSAYMPWQFRLSVCHTGGSAKNG